MKEPVVTKILSGGQVNAWNSAFPSRLVKVGDHIINMAPEDMSFRRKDVDVVLEYLAMLVFTDSTFRPPRLVSADVQRNPVATRDGLFTFEL